MSNPNTNLITYNPNTSLYQDLSGIFQPISLGTPSSIITGFKVGSQDLNEIFADLSGGSSIDFDTGFIVPLYGDLRNIFAAYNPVVPSSIPFTATGSYKTILSDTTYTVTFIGNGTITFVNEISNINLLVVGGGGVGEKYNSGFGTGQKGCGGGGAGGYVKNYTIDQLNINTYTILVGGSNTSSSFDSYSALAGNNASSNNNNTNNITTYLGGVGNGGGGSGGNGEYTKQTQDSSNNLISTTYNATNGTNGTLISWLNNTYYGGGGAGGSILPTSTSINGGAGGGGAGGGNSINAKDGNPGTTNTGGGGAGGNNGNSNDGYYGYGNGGQGGSGVVILQFTYP